MATLLTPARRYGHRNGMIPTTKGYDPIDTLFGSFFNTMLTPWGPRFFRNFQQSEDALMPRVDMTSDEKAYTLHVEIPGVNPDDVKLSINNGVLEISGEKKNDTEDKNKHVTERYYGSFSRSLTLPEDVDLEAISAAHKNGVLTVTIPRMADAGNKEKIISITKE